MLRSTLAAPVNERGPLWPIGLTWFLRQVQIGMDFAGYAAMAFTMSGRFVPNGQRTDCSLFGASPSAAVTLPLPWRMERLLPLSKEDNSKPSWLTTWALGTSS